MESSSLIKCPVWSRGSTSYWRIWHSQVSDFKIELYSTLTVLKGFWTVAYLISFGTMIYQWTISDSPKSGFGQGSVRTAIFCSFLSVFAWVGLSVTRVASYSQSPREAALSSVARDTDRASRPPSPTLMVESTSLRSLPSKVSRPGLWCSADNITNIPEGY